MIAFDPDATPWRTVAMHEIDGDAFGRSFWHMYAGVRNWQPRRFDRLVRLIADDEVANVLIVAPDCRWVLHPYDGGMDVIAESAEASRLLRNKFAKWLSSYPGGF